MSSSTERRPGVRNELVALLRAMAMPGGRKQPGRRYGPPPKATPTPVVQGRAPMSQRRRRLNYQHQTPCGSLTARQVRQLRRMDTRAIYGEKAVRRAR